MRLGRTAVETASVDEPELKARVGEVLNRWPVAGLAVGVVRHGSLAWFHGHGVADIASGHAGRQDTVFRIASITKTITAIAVMQLQEQGLVDLDAPASAYLRAYRLIPAKAGFRPATLRHLLTHTAGVRAVRKPSDLLRPALGWGTRAGRPAPPLAEYYRGGLRIDAEPGTKWAYSNHGFATLGQIVEDVSGIPFGRYLRERVFGPLGMDHSDLARSGRVRPRLATGYVLRSRGLKAVTDREVVTAGAGSVYSTTGDMARYAAALLGGGANEHGRVLEPATLAAMFEPPTSPIRGYRAWAWGSSAARPALTRPSAMTEYGMASTPPWSSPRTRASAWSRSPTPGRSAPSPRRGRLPARSCAASSASPGMPCAPAYRSSPGPGVSCAAGTPSVPACSPIPSPGCSAVSRSPSATATSPSAGRSRCPRCAGDFASTPMATIPTPSASTSPGSGRAPLPSCSAAAPAARSPPCTSASTRCPSRNAPPPNPRPWAAGALAAAAAALAAGHRHRARRAVAIKGGRT